MPATAYPCARTHRIPDGIADIGAALGLPKLPMLELRLHSGNELAPAADRLRDILHDVARSAATSWPARPGHDVGGDPTVARL